MESNLREMLAVFARAKAEGDVRAFPRHCGVLLGARVRHVQRAILTAPVGSVAELEECIRTTLRITPRGRCPVAVGVPGLAGQRGAVEAAETCSRQGLHLVMELPGMEAGEPRAAVAGRRRSWNSNAWATPGRARTSTP